MGRSLVEPVDVRVDPGRTDRLRRDGDAGQIYHISKENVPEVVGGVDLGYEELALLREQARERRVHDVAAWREADDDEATVLPRERAGECVARLGPSDHDGCQWEGRTVRCVEYPARDGRALLREGRSRQEQETEKREGARHWETPRSVGGVEFREHPDKRTAQRMPNQYIRRFGIECYGSIHNGRPNSPGPRPRRPIRSILPLPIS